ncbi:MAG: hypothetical protein ACLTFJ_11140, partial [Clostridium sp.]
QGARIEVDGTCCTECDKSGKKTASIVGDQVGLKARQVHKYIRLTELVPEILEFIDQKKITITMGVDLSYLDEQIQKWVYEYYKDNGFLKPVQVEALKNYPNLSNATQQSVISIMNDALPKKSVSAKITFSEKKLDKYFPSHFSSKDRENIIIQLLEKLSDEQGQIVWKKRMFQKCKYCTLEQKKYRMDDRIKLSYFYGKEAEQYSFIKYQSCYLRMIISKISGAKVLYGLMLDGMSLL